jgi:putative ABC transport system permease protein
MIFNFVIIIFKRSYKYLFLTFFSLLIGAFLFGAIISASKSLHIFFTEQGRVLVGGDMVFSGANEIDTSNAYFSSLQKSGHTVISELGVQVVFRSATGSSTVPAAVRAVDNEFPLYGDVTLVENGGVYSPGDFKIYVDQSFLDRIKLSVGDKVSLGTSTFIIAGTLLKEPDAVSVGISFVPKVIIAKEDIFRTGVNLSQSRVSYKVQVRKGEGLSLTDNDIQVAKTYAKENKLRFDDARDGPNNLVRGLSSVKSFAGIVVAIALFLVAVNIGANLTYILSRFKKTIALMKTFGATNQQIQSIYSVVLGAIGLIAGVCGSALGAYSANLFLPELSKYVEGVIPRSSVIETALLGGISGLILIIIASIPFFSSLKYVEPKQLLSSIAVTSQKRRVLFSFLAYTPLPLFLGIVLYGLTKNVQLVLYSIVGVIFLFVLFMAIAYGLVSYLYVKRERCTFMFSSIISFLKWRGLETIVTSAAIMTALSGVFIISAIEKNIVYNLDSSITQSAPKLYLVDITTSQLPKVKELAGMTFKEYPVIRGRIVKINNRDVAMSANGSIRREFNLTYRSGLIDGEKVIEGVWHGASKSTDSVSFEKSFAEDIGGVSVGDGQRRPRPAHGGAVAASWRARAGVPMRRAPPSARRSAGDRRSRALRNRPPSAPRTPQEYRSAS